MAEIRRPLSAVERWYWLSDQFSALNVISRVRVHGRLSIDDLRRGLDALQARHPLLRGGGGGPRGGGGGGPPPPPPGGHGQGTGMRWVRSIRRVPGVQGVPPSGSGQAKTR
ncbi:hypothetical protein I5I75_31165, partial [Pseudomonas aeruginosa]|nr:hypothetical protein [Pseudomonas aeruginosa]